MTRQTQLAPWLTLVAWLLWAWFVMTLTHELGHVLLGVIGGARLVELELRPWCLPHSIFANDNHRLVTLWAGPVLGCLVPMIVAGLVRRPAIWFVAWFCLVANASYLLLGYISGDAELDSARLIQAGARPVELLFVVAVSLPLGYYKFRNACADLLSGRTPPMTSSGLRRGSAALIAMLAIQSVIGTLLQSRL